MTQCSAFECTATYNHTFECTTTQCYRDISLWQCSRCKGQAKLLTCTVINTVHSTVYSSMYSVQCEHYSVQCTVCTLQCTLARVARVRERAAPLHRKWELGCSVHYCMYCTLYSVHCTLYTEHCTLYTVNSNMCVVQCTLSCVKCSLYSADLGRLTALQPYSRCHHSRRRDAGAGAASAGYCHHSVSTVSIVSAQCQ